MADMTTEQQRELLELAALAAGLERFTFINGKGAVYAPQPGFIQPYREWNPLTDDGDALRLAVALNLIVECMVGQSAARTFDSQCAGCCDFPSKRNDGCNRDFAQDANAATRLAITRCAAEIGRRMKENGE